MDASFLNELRHLAMPPMLLLGALDARPALQADIAHCQITIFNIHHIPYHSALSSSTALLQRQSKKVQAAQAMWCTIKKLKSVTSH